MSNFSRRRFLGTAVASATGALFLKGCLGNPPEPSGGGTASAPTAAPAAAPKDLSPELKPETPTAKLGYIPIIESTPLVIALKQGFFAKYGMTDIQISKQANWASARDNVVIGSQAGGIDGGQWQMPMPHLITEGIITDGRKVPMYVLAKLNTQGNGIAIAKAHTGKNIGLDVSKAADYIKSFPKDKGRKFKAAYTFPTANQDFWVRYWFAAGGIDPDVDIDLLAVPPAETVQGMRNGSMDAFSTGDPWPYRIITEDIGFMSALTSQMWQFHPEEYFAMRADWVDKNPKAARAIVMALMDAQKWIDEQTDRAVIAEIVSQRDFFNVPKDIILPPYKGNYKLGDGKPEVNDRDLGPLYWKDGKGSVSYPYKSHELWFLTESIRWGFHKQNFTDIDTVKKIIDKVNREDIWRDAAKSAGYEADIPASTSRGVETFFDGIQFDPEKPEEYLKSLTIKKV